MNIFVIIFSAGLGSRLKTNFPKPLSPIINSTTIDININSVIKILSKTNIRNFSIYINLHKDADKIYKYITRNYYWLIRREKLKFLFEHKPLGHIGTINKLKYNILRFDKILLINADTIIPQLDNIVENIIKINTNFIILYKMKNKQTSKTITHFNTSNYYIPNIFKVESMTKETQNLNYINLYTGVSLIKIDKNFSQFLLSELKNVDNQMNFIDLLKFLINNELLAVFTEKFYEITSIKDLLEINVLLIENKIFPLIFKTQH